MFKVLFSKTVIVNAKLTRDTASFYVNNYNLRD